MSMKGSFWLALRFFGSRGGRKKNARPLAGAVLGIALSLIPLTVVIHLAEGMVTGILERFMETWTFHLQSYTFFQVGLDEVLPVQQSIEAVEGVERTFLEKQGFGLLYSKSGQSGVTVRGLPGDLPATDPGFARYLTFRQGGWDLSEKGSILLGVNAAEELGVSAGDEVTVLTGKVFGRGRFVPKITKFTVKGVFTTGYQELDRTWVIVSLEDGERILSPDNSRLLIGIKVAEPWNPVLVSRIRDRILRELPSGWFVYSWDELSGSYRNNFQTTRGILVLIMAMLVLVAVINVASSLIMIVLERSQEIGILKCTGTSPEDVSGMFLMIGMLVGVTGAVAGLVPGIFISLFYNQIIRGIEGFVNFFIRLADLVIPGQMEAVTLINTSYYLESVPVRLQAAPILTVFIFTVLLSVVVSGIPAYRAGRIRPLDVIRKH
jgi:lipoprotein-releasing system permease protein